jgi:acylphosphatase
VKHFNFHITGTVQGVFFRAHTRKKAEELGVKGFVRNEPDGSVYIEAEAPQNIIDQFILWCHKGPERATVTTVEVNEGPLKSFTTFEIRRQ